MSTKIEPNLLVITGSRYNRYRYIYIRASTKTFNYGIWGVKNDIIVCAGE